MSACILLRVKGDDTAYLVDLNAGAVSRVSPDVKVELHDEQQFQGVDFAVVSEQRDATATFPSFAD